MARRIRPLSAAFLPLYCMAGAVGLGCWWMAQGGAPKSFIAINIASVALALMLSFLRPARWMPFAALALAPALAAGAILLGHSIDGVHRWIGGGNVRIHAVMLAGPVFAVAALQIRGRVAAVAAIILAGLISWQPDPGTLLALSAAVGMGSLATRDAPLFLAFLASFALLVLGWFSPTPLAPVEHVEGVASAMWTAGTPLGLAALALLGLAITLPLRAGSGGPALFGWYAGLLAASLLAPYPTPLLGYGASAIIGYALGFVLIGRR